MRTIVTERHMPESLSVGCSTNSQATLDSPAPAAGTPMLALLLTVELSRRRNSMGSLSVLHRVGKVVPRQKLLNVEHFTTLMMQTHLVRSSLKRPKANYQRAQREDAHAGTNKND